MAKTATPSTQRSSPVVPRVKVWLEADGEYVFGRGISDILKAVDEAGSIKAGAERIGKSYRHVWSRIKEAEEQLDITLVETQVGGAGDQRSTLSELARELIAHYDALRARVLDLVATEFSTQFEQLLSRRRRGTKRG